MKSGQPRVGRLWLAGAVVKPGGTPIAKRLRVIKQKKQDRPHANGGQGGSSSHEAAHKTAEEITQCNVETIDRLQEAAQGPPQLGDRIAARITTFGGSFTIVWIHVLWFGGWILANLTLPKPLRFDPLPFPFLTLIVSLEAIFLSTFIMITQRRQSKLDERRARLDLQINLLSEQENTKMLELLKNIAIKLGVPTKADGELGALEQPTSLEKLLDQIEESATKTEKRC